MRITVSALTAMSLVLFSTSCSGGESVAPGDGEEDLRVDDDLGVDVDAADGVGDVPLDGDADPGDPPPDVSRDDDGGHDADTETDGGDVGPEPTCDYSGANPDSLIFVGDFEHGITPLTADNPESPFYSAGSNGVDPVVVASPEHPVRCGNYSMMSYVHAPEYRSEVVPKGAESRLTLDIEYWFGVSIFLPADWSEDYSAGAYDDGIVFQLHHNSWSGYPEMELPLILQHQPSLEWRVRCAGENGQNPVILHHSSFLPDKGKWTDWVFNVRFSAGAEGFIRVWKDGEQVADHAGSNYAEGHPEGPNFQFGLYQWGYDEGEPLGTDERTIYHDEFRLGNSSARYEDVAPGGLSAR